MEKISKFLKMILVIFILNFSNLFSQWEQIGPSGGIVLSLAASDNYIFAGTEDGVYLSSDYGIR